MLDDVPSSLCSPLMDTATSVERTAVAARDHHGRPCTVTVERHRQAAHRLHYDGGEHTTALLTAEVIELLTIALAAATGRTTILAVGRGGQLRWSYGASSRNDYRRGVLRTQSRSTSRAGSTRWSRPGSADRAGQPRRRATCTIWPASASKTPASVSSRST